jgi:hypothetical protein
MSSWEDAAQAYFDISYIELPRTAFVGEISASLCSSACTSRLSSSEFTTPADVIHLPKRFILYLYSEGYDYETLAAIAASWGCDKVVSHAKFHARPASSEFRRKYCRGEKRPFRNSDSGARKVPLPRSKGLARVYGKQGAQLADHMWSMLNCIRVLGNIRASDSISRVYNAFLSGI